jgi:hypothetical protein
MEDLLGEVITEWGLSVEERDLAEFAMPGAVGVFDLGWKRKRFWQ